MALDIKSFRKLNRISQSELADFLGVSRGFISLIETSKTILSKDNIDKLFKSSGKMGWNTEALNPHYHRLVTAAKELSERSDLYAEIDIDGNNPFGIEKVTMCKIRYGKFEITPVLADYITTQVPCLSKAWLLSGNGEHFVASETQPSSTTSPNDDILERIYQKLCSIEELLSQVKPKE